MKQVPNKKGEMKMNNLIPNRKVLAVFSVVVFVLSMLVVAAPVRADPGILYVDDDYPNPGACGGNTPCYAHPQDAVNAGNPGDTILVYPGTYGSRQYTFKPPHWGPNDQWAPALIVYKDNLVIQAVHPDPSLTVIQSTHNFWSNPVAIQASTGGTWDGVKYVGAGVYPKDGTSPSAVIIVADGVTIDGFTLKRHFEGTYATYNTAGVFIGSLCAGCSDLLGSDGATVKNCVFDDVWHAVYIWHSSINKIIYNKVNPLTTNHWAAISTYDGYNDDQVVKLGHPSENNFIAYNTLANKGIALGAWDPPTWTSNAGSKVCCNTATQVGVTYAHGPVIIGCNTGGFWQVRTDKVLRIKGVTYTGDTMLWASDTVPVNLKAQLSYDGSADGNGVEVVFTVGGTPYSTITGAGGMASTTASLSPGIYTVETKVTVCDKCNFTDMDTLVIGRIVLIDIKPGSYPNSINLKSKGVVPVALLGSGLFDVSTVDASTVRFAGAAPVRWSMEDVNSDGYMDIVFHFQTQSLTEWNQNSAEATLTGSTYSGIPIKGTDTVNIVPK